jgi:hypothetical protein
MVLIQQMQTVVCQQLLDNKFHLPIVMQLQNFLYLMGFAQWRWRKRYFSIQILILFVTMY